MKTPLSWISIYTPLQSLFKKHTVSELAHKYSIHTAEIDDIIEHNLDKIVIAKVISCEKHPDSKKLSIVRVNMGEHGEETILTGAANIINAKFVPVAMVGAVLGWDFEIWERKMAGMMSRGMICAEDEIGLVSDRADGILELENFWDESLLENNLGKSVFNLSIDFIGINGETIQIPLKDVTFEIDNKFITNRPDLFSIIGNAREWGAIFNLKYTDPLKNIPKISDIAKQNIAVNIESDACLSYHLLESSGLSTQTSPLGMRILMERAGLSVKNNIVDITNCILTEYGQPMHAFDADKVIGKISVRKAKNGEILDALNGESYELSENDLIIADENGPIALAGIIGGNRTAVSETTTRIFWESATFDANTIRLSSQKYGIRTDASTRFEKSLDPLLAEKVFSRVNEYLDFMDQKYSHNGFFAYINTNKINTIELQFPVSLISKRAGTNISHENILSILKSLWFETNLNKEILTVKVPSWRASKDISINEDIIEEVLRIFGYENIEPAPFSGTLTIQNKNNTKLLTDAILAFFSGKNFSEIYNYSFTNQDLQTKIHGESTENLIAIKNAYTEDFTHMRDSLAPRIFESIANNLRHSNEIAFFEIGKIYGKNISSSHNLQQLISLQNSKPFWEKKYIAWAKINTNITEIRTILDAFFTQIIGKIPEISQQSKLPFLHPGASWNYQNNNEILANFGKIHPEVAKNFEIPENTLYFEIDFERLLKYFENNKTKFAHISAYQAISREFNFLMPKNDETGKLAQIITSVHPWISNVIVEDIFEDAEKLWKDKKSVTFSCTIQSPDGTITAEESKKIHEEIISKAEKNGFTLRM